MNDSDLFRMIERHPKIERSDQSKHIESINDAVSEFGPDIKKISTDASIQIEQLNKIVENLEIQLESAKEDATNANAISRLSNAFAVASFIVALASLLVAIIM